MPDIIIIGAGLAGLSAGINLARRGYTVRILEKEPGVGGSPRLAPGIHFSGAEDLAALSGWLNFDLAKNFYPAEKLQVWIGDRKVEFSTPEKLLLVERGARPTSLDQSLYRAALQLGIKFEFGYQLKSLREAPPGTILTGGHDPELYRALNFKTGRFVGYAASDKTDIDRRGFVYLDEYATDAFYGGFLNGLFYALVYSMRPVSPAMLPRCAEQLYAREGVGVKEWRAVCAEYPAATMFRPRLYYRGRILAGALAGANSPLSGLGINAALVSGRIAAQAVYDREGAERLFHCFIKWHLPLAFMRMGFAALPPGWRLGLARPAALFPGLAAKLVQGAMLNVPGYRLPVKAARIL